MVNLDNLFKLIDGKGLTKAKVAAATGISTGNISDWKNGRSMPTAIKLDILANYLDCSVDYLLGRTDNPNIASDNFTIHDGIQAVSKDSSHFTFNHVDDSQDENQEELLKRFKMLDYEDKIEIMQMIIQKTKMKGNK
ncbi:MAG: helix-turn-helix transcriptional regulator [Oscillospiraceae bacterium]|nr:helix-turn-helix transcriptional regulator [Oscillospiraceae bacterium]